MFLKRGWKLILIPQDSALLAKYSRIVCENFIARKRDFRREKLLELSRVFRLMDISRLESCSIDWKITMKSGKCTYIYRCFFPSLNIVEWKKEKKKKGRKEEEAAIGSPLDVSFSRFGGMEASRELKPQETS